MATAKQVVDFLGATVRQFLGITGSGNPTWKVPTDWKTTRFEEVQVTPQLAQYIYDVLGDFNRRISPTDPKVIELADDMKNGRWAKIGLVEFDWDGHLLNGYHRMLAIILSGVTVTMFFRYGADPKDYVAFDKGKNRDGQDIFEIEAQVLGEDITAADAKLMSSAMLWIVQYECGKATIPFKITSFHQRDFYRKRFSEKKKGEDFELRSWALPLTRKVAKAVHVAESVIFALIVLGYRTEGKKGATKEFWNAVATDLGFTGEDDPRRRFIKRIETMIAEAAKYKMKVQRGATYLLGLKCMRAYFDGETIPVNFHNPKKIVRLCEEHDEIFGDVDFVSPYGEKAAFDEDNTKLVEELVTKHEDRGK